MISNRQRPLRVWGPSGAKPEYGTKYAVEKMQEMLVWDSASRMGNVNTQGQKIELHEFDYKGVNQVVYQENGVTIRSLPAIHECFLPPELLVEKQKFPVQDALNVGTQVHTSPAMFGKVPEPAHRLHRVHRRRA